MEELTARADDLMGRGQWAEAEALLLSARDDALAAGRTSAALSLNSELMGFYRMYGKKEPFESAMASSLAALENMRVPPAARGTILINAATGLVAFGRAEEALPYYAEAAECYAAALPAVDYRFAALYNNMAAAYQASGELDSAGEYMYKAVSILERLPHHPDLGMTYVNLAQLYAAKSDDAEASAYLDRAMVIFDDPEMLWDGYYAHTLQKCVGAFEAFGRTTEAADLRERAEVIYEGT